ncbi:MAG: Hpt domain-containing protein [Candidatus Sericytochromatia bacterium]|nr:Hpt domain-containing protein [Candidatus Sericytochromatia bacterium]
MAQVPDGFSFAGDPELADLFQVFLDQVHRRFDQIAAMIAQLAAMPDDRPALKQLSHHFHGLAGSGSSFGFPNVSQLGQSGDQTCLRRLETGTPPDAADLATWRRLLTELHAAVPADRTMTVASQSPHPEAAAAAMR